jgi:hypothetical protein
MNIFTKISGTAQTIYLLVNVIKAFTDPNKPTITGGGDLGYPVTTCTNMLVVDMWLQTDGSTNFQGAQLVSTYNNSKTPPIVVSIINSPHLQIYNQVFFTS